MHIGELGRHVVVSGEPQSPRGQIVGQQLAQAGLIKGNVTPGELGYLAGIDIDTNDLVSEFRHPGRMGSTQITSAEDGASHTTGVGGRDELTASLR
jgi:hypothetical protein